MIGMVARDSSIAAATARGSPPTRVMSEASMATSAPVPMAIPRSAWARAGASLMPSPTIATRPRACSRSTWRPCRPGCTSASTRCGGDTHLARRPRPSPGRRRSGARPRCRSRRAAPTASAARLDGSPRAMARPARRRPRPRRRPPAASADAVAASQRRRGDAPFGQHRRLPTRTARDPSAVSTDPSTPPPATASKPSTGAEARARRRGRGRGSRPSGCSLPFSATPARSRSSRRRKPGAGATAATVGRPSVSVPVLSRTTAVTVGDLQRLAAADEDARPRRRGRSRP